MHTNTHAHTQQCELLERFPEEAGTKDPASRMIPFLPGRYPPPPLPMLLAGHYALHPPPILLAGHVPYALPPCY